MFKTCGISYSTLSSSPPDGDGDIEEDPWADKTTELSFSGAAANKHDEAGSSSDEDNEAAPVKMEVDNDQDRKFKLHRSTLF